MPKTDPNSTLSGDPAELRGIFGANLRLLGASYPSIAGLCRELGINRTQFNRYLSSESFPRPDVLHRICSFFGVDARILLQPVASLRDDTPSLLNHPFIADYLGNGSLNIPEETLPSGFYRFTRRSFVDDQMYVVGLVFVSRIDNNTFVRGYEAKESMRQQGLATDANTREFRGMFLAQEEGIAALIARHGAMTCSFNFLSRVASIQNNFWEGYVTRTVRESLSGNRAARMVYEHIENDRGAVFAAARSAGLCREDQLAPFHRRLLRIGEPFQ
ncbi:MAG: helix-turn-helix transcriptional regulator [Rhodobacterales bacterium]|nr:helix-turn-helix transcriptional regulator [Rhodobacterales bacterium]